MTPYTTTVAAGRRSDARRPRLWRTRSSESLRVLGWIDKSKKDTVIIDAMTHAIRKVVFALSLVSLSFANMACPEKGPAEKAGEKIDKAVDDTKDAAKDAAEEIKDATKDVAK